MPSSNLDTNLAQVLSIYQSSEPARPQMVETGPSINKGAAVYPAPNQSKDCMILKMEYGLCCGVSVGHAQAFHLIPRNAIRVCVSPLLVVLRLSSSVQGAEIIRCKCHISILLLLGQQQVLPVPALKLVGSGDRVKASARAACYRHSSGCRLAAVLT